MRWIVVCLLMLSVLNPCRGAEQDEDLAALQGKWVQTRADAQGAVLRIEKTVQGQCETTRLFDPEGRVTQVQSSEFRLERSGKLRLLHWSQAQVLEGPRKGARIPDGTAVYTLNGERWTSVIGLAEGDPFTVHVEVWTRDGEEQCGTGFQRVMLLNGRQFFRNARWDQSTIIGNNCQCS